MIILLMFCCIFFEEICHDYEELTSGISFSFFPLEHHAQIWHKFGKMIFLKFLSVWWEFDLLVAQ